MKIIKRRILYRFHPYIRLVKRIIFYKSNLKTKLYPFQELCLEWIKFRRKYTKAVIIPSGTGTGKTLIAHTHCEQYNGNALWICPQNLIEHHKNEITKHFSKEIKNIKFIGFFDFVRLDANDPIIKHKYNTIVLDEIHLIKKNTKFAKLLYYLRYDFLIGLSASIGGFIFDDLNVFQNLDIKTDIFNCITTKFKKLEIKQIKLQLNPNEIKIYNQTIDSISHLKSTSAKLNHLREWLSNHRIDLVLNFLQSYNHDNIKIVLFSDFNSTLLTLSFLLPPKTFIRIDPSISLKKRNQALKNFETNPNLKYLLYNRKLGGTGIDLGFVAIEVLLEPTYHQDETDQVAGRLQRLGQSPINSNEQFIYEFQYENSCEGKIANSKIVDENLVSELLKNNTIL